MGVRGVYSTNARERLFDVCDVCEREVLVVCGGGPFVAGGGQFFRCSSGSFDLAHRPTRRFYTLRTASAAHSEAAQACSWGKAACGYAADGRL